MLRIGMRKGANMRTSISRGVIVVATLCVALSSAVVLAEDNGGRNQRSSRSPRGFCPAPKFRRARSSARGTLGPRQGDFL